MRCEAERKVDRTLERVSAKAETMIDDLQRVIRRIKEDGREASLNTCGELQGVNDFEALVGQAMAYKDSLILVNELLDYATESVDTK